MQMGCSHEYIYIYSLSEIMITHYSSDLFSPIVDVYSNDDEQDVSKVSVDLLSVIDDQSADEFVMVELFEVMNLMRNLLTFDTSLIAY